MAREKQTSPQPSGKVRALVLLDCIYGKCGEVKEFDVSEVDAIAAAGYIDPHPNAISGRG